MAYFTLNSRLAKILSYQPMLDLLSYIFNWSPREAPISQGQRRPDLPTRRCNRQRGEEGRGAALEGRGGPPTTAAVTSQPVVPATGASVAAAPLFTFPPHSSQARSVRLIHRVFVTATAHRVDATYRCGGCVEYNKETLRL
ncbi:hypothetical protein J6590_016613 [Homalodisca vitripennis]|nr:hypothetical protein J6590_016613 [Homalodisca vitripennis]